MTFTVVLTRPRDDTDRLAQALEAKGWSVLAQPMLKMEPVAPDTLVALPELTDNDLAIFISANAVRMGLPHVADTLRAAGVLSLAVGRKTAAALEAVDLPVVSPEREDSDGLLALSELADVADRRVIIIKGEGGRGLLSRSLRERGAEVIEFVCYQRVNEVIDAAAFASTLAAARPLLIQASSEQTLQRITELLAEGGQPTLVQETLIVPSERVAQAAQALGWRRVKCAGDASDEAFYQTLEGEVQALREQDQKMSEKESDQAADSVTPEAGASAPGAAPQPTAEAASQAQAPLSVGAATIVAARDGFARFLFFLLLIVVVGAAGAGYWYGKPLFESQSSRQSEADEQVMALQEEIDSFAEQQQTQMATMAAREQRLATLADGIEQRLKSLTGQQASAARSQQQVIDQSRREQQDELRRFDNRLARIEQQLARLTGTDRRAWLVQEAAFLTRLSSQRLLVARDINAAEALLGNADDLLAEADDPALEAARRMLAKDRAKLRALPQVDVTGLHARLSALVDAADELAVAPPEALDSNAASGAEQDWLTRAKAGWQAALAKLSSYLVIRERNKELDAALSPEWQALARQNQRMLLEQAQVALLSSNQTLYNTAIGQARDFALRLREADPDAVDAMIRTLDELAEAQVAPVLPDLLASRKALDDAVRALNAAAPGA